MYICWYASIIFLDNKYSHTISWWESLEKLVRYTTYVGYCVVWAIFNKKFQCILYPYICFENIFLTLRLDCHITSDHTYVVYLTSFSRDSHQEIVPLYFCYQGIWKRCIYIYIHIDYMVWWSYRWSRFWGQM